MIPALIPAAGLSARMGSPKPLLDVAGQPLLGTIISALRYGGASPVIVVTPPSIRAEATAIIELARSAGAEVVTPSGETPDMRATIELGLDRLEQAVPDALGLLLCPCDVPGISPALVARVIAELRHHLESIIVPTYAGKRGHPAFLPRKAFELIRRLPQGKGVKSLFDHSTIPLTEFAWDEALDDVDTPEDFARWSGQNGQ